jgi:hypothetical protein
MKEVKLGKPEELIRRIDFTEIVPSDDKAQRIGSKVYILSHGVINDKFYLRNIKGDLEGIDKPPEKIREKIGVYSETELENLKREFLDTGYLEQEEGSSAYSLTERGRILFETYIELFRALQISKKIEYRKVENNLESLENLEDVRKDTGELSDEMKDELAERMKAGERPEEVFVSEGRFQNVNNQKELNKLIDQLYQKSLDVGDSIQKLQLYSIADNRGRVEETEEIQELSQKLTEKPYAPDFLVPDEEVQEEKSQLQGEY